MRTFLILLLAYFANAKPQYNYPAPSRPSIPSGSYGGPTGGCGGGGGGGSSFGGGCGGGIGSGSGSGFGIGSGSSGLGFGSGGSISSGGALSSGGGGGVLVQKHIYVHVAPPEPQETRPQRPISAGQATKHYKIIFIKAPSYEQQQQQILQAQAQNEEKTLVYVLVKKPDELADISVPTVAPTAPSKPEVYFIRYKAKTEVTSGGHAIGDGVGGGIIGGGLGSGTGGGIGISTGDSSSSISSGRPSSNYGPPGQSGPY